jgi:hypothetical protein
VRGKNLLDIIAWNETMVVMWLKTYLSFGPDYPWWCFVTNKILANRVVAADLNVNEAIRINTYLQSWALYQSKEDLGSKDLADMMKTGRTYGVAIDTIAVLRANG